MGEAVPSKIHPTLVCMVGRCASPVFVVKRQLCRFHYGRAAELGFPEPLPLDLGRPKHEMRRAARDARITQPCGTMAGYRRHYKARQEPCEPCAEAMRQQARERYARKKAAGLIKSRRVVLTHHCKVCATPFESTSAQALYCSDQCRPWAKGPSRPRRTVARVPRRTGRPYKRLRRQVLAEESHCGICGGEIDSALKWPHPLSPTLDHVEPVSAGGDLLDRSNCRAAHFYCNSSRSNRTYYAPRFHAVTKGGQWAA
jgi:5-methylcytosine-specific restriction endonuclease McrA